MTSYKKMKQQKGKTMVAISEVKTREQKKQQTRDAFFNAVLDLCMTGQSFSSISLRQVTREVGVVPTAFYRHFDDMEALGQALVEDELGVALATLREHMHLGRKRSFERQIAKSVQCFFNAIDEQPKHWHFIASERFGGSEAVRKAIGAQIDLFATIMGEDLGLQPVFTGANSHDRRLLAQTGLDLSFAWIVDWLELSYNAMHDEDVDQETINCNKDVMLKNCTRQSQMLFYGAYNWQSHENP